MNRVGASFWYDTEQYSQRAEQYRFWCLETTSLPNSESELKAEKVAFLKVCSFGLSLVK